MIGVETAGLNEHELGEYCRRKGVFTQPVQAWRAAVQRHPRHRAGQEHRREQAREIRHRRGERHCKDKALAEAAALRRLPKKVQAWLDGGEGASSTSWSVGQ
jgi:transposase